VLYAVPLPLADQVFSACVVVVALTAETVAPVPIAPVTLVPVSPVTVTAQPSLVPSPSPIGKLQCKLYSNCSLLTSICITPVVLLLL
jgi:hypothetical protein